MFLQTVRLLFLSTCFFFGEISTQSDDSIPAGLLGGIENVAFTATNFLANAVERPRNLLLNATRATTGIIDSAASRGLEFKLRRFLEKFRSRMSYGIPELGIPPLEPFQLDEIYIETDNPEIGNVSLVIEDLTVRKLSTYSVDRAKLSLMGPSVAVNISVPDIYATGFYNISGILGGMFPLFGAGQFEGNIYNCWVYVNIVLGFSRGMYMRHFDLDFGLESADIRLKNFMGDDAIGRVMNQVLQELMPQIVHIIKPDVLPGIQDYITNTVNDAIRHLTMRDLINIVLGENEIRGITDLIMP